MSPQQPPPSKFETYAKVTGAGLLTSGALALLAANSIYKKCPPNKLLVVYGRFAGGIFSTSGMRIVKNGGATVFPLLQSSSYLSLMPMSLDIPLKGALSLEKIRVNVPSVFTVAISPQEDIANKAAQRLLNLDQEQTLHLAEEVIVGQMRQVLAGLSIDEINQDREKFVGEVERHCESELQKLGLTLLNTNVKNITDESGVIEAQGKKAAETARQQALIEVATLEKLGKIGVSKEEREQEVTVGNNLKDRDIGVREAQREAVARIEDLEAQELTDVNLARQKKSESEAALAIAQAVYKKQSGIAQQEAEAAVDEASATARTRVAKAHAEQVEAETRATLEAKAKAEKAKAIVDAEAKAEEIRIIAQAQAESAKAEKAKAILDAEAKAEEIRVIAQAQADSRFAEASAAARGQAHGLKMKAEGLQAIIEACGGSDEAYRLLLLEHIDTLAETNARAISNLRFDKVVVWDGGSSENGAVSNFVKDVTKSMPPMLDVLKDFADIDLQANVGGNKTKSLPESVSTFPASKNSRKTLER